MEISETIDILLATYNGEKNLEAQLQSIIDQTYSNWNLIVRDDNSTDKTMDILECFKNQYPDKINIVKDNYVCGSAKKNFFRLFNYSTSKYIACCDQDDYWLENKLEIMVKELKKIERKGMPALVYSDLYVVDSKLNIISDSFFDYSMFPKNASKINDILIQNCVTGCAMMFNDELREYLVKDYNIDNIIMHDWLAGLIAYTLGTAKFVDQSLIKYRQHDSNTVGANNPKTFKNAIIQARKGFKFARKVVTDTYAQIQEFYDINQQDIPIEIKNLLIGYGNLKNQTKIKRLYFYRLNNIKKQGIIRKIWLLIFG